MEIIHEELRLKDLEFLGKRLADLEKLFVRGGDKQVGRNKLTKIGNKTILFYFLVENRV